MKTIFLLSIVLLSFSVQAQKTSKRDKSKKPGTEVISANEAYRAIIYEADKNYSAQNYVKAKELYQKALSIKSELYPYSQIDLIDRMLREISRMETKDFEYKKLMYHADKANEEGDYLKAKEYYIRGLEIRPDDPYPKQKLAEIEVIFKEQKSKSDSITSVADSLFAYKQYHLAKVNYSEVLKLKPNDIHATERLVEINSILETDGGGGDQKKMAYEKAIIEADIRFKAKDYSGAKTYYVKALEINASEAYPKQQVYEIEEAQAAINAEKVRMETYHELIAKADKLFLSKKYVEAKSVYDEALLLMPAEIYPKQQIIKIQKFISEEEK